MKAKLLAIITAFVSVAGLYAQESYIETGQTASSGLELKLLSTDELQTSVSANLSGFYTSQLTINGVEYNSVRIEDAVSLGSNGEPALPVVTKFVKIPNGKDVKIRIVKAEYTDLFGYKVSPYNDPPLRSSSADIKNTFADRRFYSTDQLSPEEIVSVSEIAAFRDHRVAVITISPFQHNPVSGLLRVHHSIEFDIVCEGVSNVNNTGISSVGISKSFDMMYRQLILNYESPVHFAAAPKLLILTADELISGVAPLAGWKQWKGIKTTVLKKSEIAGVPSPSAEQVKSFLVQMYNSPDRPEFVLIIGDASGTNTFPWFTATGGKSDHPYQCLEGSDILPDIVVGRISVQTLAELDSAVNKLVQYEKQPNSQQSEWYKRALVLHSNDGIDPVNGQVAKRVFETEGGFTNVDLVNNSFTQSQITGLINQGVSWIWFIGHGSSTSWADPVWNMSNMPNLNFGLRQPSIISIACSNADLDYSTTNNCFGEAWIERERGNSASNIAASTELCAFYTTDTIGREMLYSYFRHGIGDFGSMLNFGKIKAYQYFNGNGTVTETINQFMVLGDPSQEAFSDIPKNVNVTSSLAGNNYVVNVKAGGSNVKGCLAAIHQSDSLRISGYTDSLGNFSFSKDILHESAPVTCVVTGRNLMPYEGVLILTSVNGGSMSPDVFSLEQNYPNPFNPSTVINFSLSERAFATLKVYDMLGRQVAQLVGGYLDRGSYSVDFNASELPAGVYVYRLSSGGLTKTLKMTLLK